MADYVRPMAHRTLPDALPRPQDMFMRIADFPAPDTLAAQGAFELATQHQSPLRESLDPQPGAQRVCRDRGGV
jgi:hypothetical protein